MKIGFTPKEARGALVALSLIMVVVAAKFFYNWIELRSLQESTFELETLEQADSVQLFEFDPNRVTLPELMDLGLSRSEAVSIIRYREYGKVFRIKEDLFTCYGISDSLYYALEPYITIGEEYRPKRRSEEKSYSTSRYRRELLKPSKFLVDTVGVKYLVAIGALSRRQAEVFVSWRDASGIYNLDELRECYVVSDSTAAMLAPYAIFSEYVEPKPRRVDLNKADSAALRSVYGIGEKSVVAILDYRQKLGGFYSSTQLSELKVVTESNFEKIIKQISCDSCDISKIDVNFATAKTMKGHPYITDKVLRRLLKIRDLKGGWSTIEEMIEDNIFTREEATRVRPYLLFGEFSAVDTTDREFK